MIGPLFSTDLTLSASWPSDNLGTGWEARGVEWTPTAISWRLRVIALCANIANPYQVIIGRALGFVETLLLIAECPADTLAIGGGGGRMDMFPSERIFLQHIFTDTMLDSSKTIAGFRTLSNIGFTGDARAICIVPYVFGDGLESGDTSAWSGTQ